MTPFTTYDTAGYERFCAALVEAGFSPIPGKDGAEWVGPLRASLAGLTSERTMSVTFYPGWPLRYAHITVPGLHQAHSRAGLLCLWAEDDPAQIEGRNIDALWERLDTWVSKAVDGFGEDDVALDSYYLFRELSGFSLEIPLGDLLRGATNGHRANIDGQVRGTTIQVRNDRDVPILHGVLYFRNALAEAPRDLDDFRAHLTNRQRLDLETGLSGRADVALNKPSGGYDFAVLAWPSFLGEVDAVAIGFSGAGNTIRAAAHAPSPSDTAARRRRAGPDAELIANKKVLVVGLGSVGGATALLLAESGLSTLSGADSDVLKSANLVRHVASEYAVGYKKTIALKLEIDEHAPWCEFDGKVDLPLDPAELAETIEGYDLVIDCTGNFAVAAALSTVCGDTDIALVSGALYHHGAVMRVRRQAPGDLPIADREGSDKYVSLPQQEMDANSGGFLEVGCTAPVNSSPPWAAQRLAADIAAIAADFLTGRLAMPDEQVAVLVALESSPFDVVGPVSAAGS